MDDLVVAEGQHEVLVEGVEPAEGERVVVEAAMHRIVLHVRQRVVHPAHVPLEAEPQASQPDRPRHAGPGGGLLRVGLDARLAAEHLGVQPLQEADGLEVLAAAMHVGDPFAGLAGVVEVEHGRDGVHAQAVGVVAVQPEHPRREQEAAHLVASVVEDEALPIGMETLAGIGMLVEGGSVEVRQPHLVRGEVRGHPVEDDADPGLVQPIDQVHEVLRGAVPAGGREVARRLVAPRSIERVFHHGQELDVGEPEALQVFAERVGQLAIVERAVSFFRTPLPGPDVHLVDGDGRVEGAARAAFLHPLRIAPFVVEVPDDRGGPRRRLRVDGERIRLVHPIAALPFDVELVLRALSDPLDESLPDAGLAARRQGVLVLVPGVPVADHVHHLRVGGPDGELGPARLQMRAQVLIQPEMGAFVEEVEIVVGEERNHGVVREEGNHGGALSLASEEGQQPP